MVHLEISNDYQVFRGFLNRGAFQSLFRKIKGVFSNKLNFWLLAFPTLGFCLISPNFLVSNFEFNEALVTYPIHQFA